LRHPHPSPPPQAREREKNAHSLLSPEENIGIALT
jgi:hypothetical protein